MGWKNPVNLSDEQIETELLGPLIERLNEHREIDSTWSCAGMLSSHNRLDPERQRTS